MLKDNKKGIANAKVSDSDEKLEKEKDNKANSTGNSCGGWWTIVESCNHENFELLSF